MRGPITVAIDHNSSGLVTFQGRYERPLDSRDAGAFCEWATKRIAAALGPETVLVYCWSTGREMMLVERLGATATISGVHNVELTDERVAFGFVSNMMDGNVKSSGIMVVRRMGDTVERHAFDVRDWARQHRPGLLR